MTRPTRRQGWPFWFAMAVIAVAFLYVASFGPACWCTKPVVLGWFTEPYGPLLIVLPPIYRPLGAASAHIPWVRSALRWYGRLFLERRGDLVIFIGKWDVTSRRYDVQYRYLAEEGYRVD